MATTHQRKTVCIPTEIMALLRRDCRRNRKPIATRIIEIVAEGYAAELKQPVMFGRSQRSLGRWQEAPMVVFRVPSPPEPEQASGPRAIQMEAKI